MALFARRAEDADGGPNSKQAAPKDGSRSGNDLPITLISSEGLIGRAEKNNAPFAFDVSRRQRCAG